MEQKRLRLPPGILKELGRISGEHPGYISDLASAKRRPSRKLASRLERACAQLGMIVPRMTWLYGTEREIKGPMGGREIAKAGSGSRKRASV